MSAVRTLGAAVVVVVLIAGVTAIAYARWTVSIADADAALADGRLEQALAGYAAAEARFDRSAAARQLFAADYGHVMANQLWVLYRLARYDETIDAAAPARKTIAIRPAPMDRVADVIRILGSRLSMTDCCSMFAVLRP